jgi:hypothetical protein
MPFSIESIKKEPPLPARRPAPLPPPDEMAAMLAAALAAAPPALVRRVERRNRRNAFRLKMLAENASNPNG